MIVIGCDPGTEKSALVTWTGDAIASTFFEENTNVAMCFREAKIKQSVLVIEEFESYGMAVGREVFRTIRWAGNFEAFWYPGRVEFLPRRVVKQHLCHTARATDANIRQALIDRFGGSKAIGTKKEQGPLYTLKGHLWAAFAVALTWHDMHGSEDPVRPGVSAEF